MFIRCFSCRGVTWVEGDCRKQCVLECGNCGSPLNLRNVTTQDSRTRFEDAVRFAEASAIDLPAANSVLLGVMTLQQALSIQGKSALAPSADEPSRMEQAADEALRSLEQVRARRVVVASTVAQTPVPEQQSRAALVAACAMLAVSIAISVLGWNLWAKEVATAQALEIRPKQERVEALQPETTAEPQPVAYRGSAKARRNRDDQVVQVIGHTPEAVLRTFCEKSGVIGQYEPLELATTNPYRIGVRVGILRDYRDLSQTYAIWIQQRRTDRKWVAGSGKIPLKPFAVDFKRVGDSRIEVSREDPDQSG